MPGVDGMAFNPWYAPTAHRPFGNIHRARRRV